MLDVGYYLIMIGSIVAGVGLCFCMIGFGCNGVSSNSYASSYQSIIGNVSRGSCFSLLYSFGMKGLLEDYLNKYN